MNEDKDFILHDMEESNKLLDLMPDEELEIRDFEEVKFDRAVSQNTIRFYDETASTNSEDDMAFEEVDITGSILNKDISISKFLF